MIIKLLKTNDKEKTLKTTKEKRYIYGGTKITMIRVQSP